MAPGPGRGPGRLPPSAEGSRRTLSRCCWRAAWAALTAASCSAFSAAARASAAATSMSWALAGFATGAAGCGGPGNGPLGFAGPGIGAAGRRGGIGLAETRGAPGAGEGVGVWFEVEVEVGAGADAGGAAGVGAPAEATNALRSRRATGASTVLDADFTNSPISLSLARTVLLSTPSSFASSCTRALPATALLTPRSCGQQPAATSLLHLKPGHFRDFIVCSCRSSYPASDPRPVGLTGRSGWRIDVLCQHTVVEDLGDAQRSPKGAAPHRQREAGRIRVHVRSPTRQPAERIRPEAVTSPVPDRDDPQQFAGRRALPATHTGALRLHASYHWRKSTPSCPRSRRPAPVPDQLRHARQARPAPRRSGCRSANRSNGQRGGRSAPPGRWRGRAGNPGR